MPDISERIRVANEADHGSVRSREPWGILALLLVIGTLNYLDRMLPGILAEPIRTDLHLTDTVLGIINGFGFLMIYAVAGIPIAKLADRGRHVVVIVGALAGWSVMTALGSLAGNGWIFGATRVGVALGEAGATPASHAFISRNFSPGSRAKALAILSIGGAGGSLLGMMAGGFMGEHLGWRQTFLLMGLAGLALAPAAWWLMCRHAIAKLSVEAADTEPVGGIETREGKWIDLLRTRSGILIVLACSLIATGAYSTNAFGPAYVIRVHGLSIAETGLKLGLSAGLGGVLALLVTGWIADRLARRDARWTLGVLAATMMLAAPFYVAACFVADGTAAILLIGTSAALMNSYIPLAVVSLYRLVSPDVRARTSAILLFSTAVFGGLGPLLVGLVSDALTPTLGVSGLRYAMLVVPACAVLGALLYFAASVTYAADVIGARRNGEGA